MTLAGVCGTSGYAYDVAISGDYAYVADYNYGLAVLDISNPPIPALVASCVTPGFAHGVTVSGDYAYLASDGLRVIDITDPTSPVIAGSLSAPGWSWDVAVSGDYAYLANDSGGLKVIDISDPTSPTLVGTYHTPSLALGVAVDGDYAYIADSYWGLEVVEVYQRRYDLEANVGRSLEIGGSNYTIERVRLSTTQTDSIRWQVSADGGTTWEELLPGVWHTLAQQGSSLLWKSTHYYTGAGINPLCSYLEIEWTYTVASVDGGTGAGELPAVFALRPNRPNPFSLKTSVAFDLPVGCAVSLEVFDAQGRQVRTLADQIYPAGRQSVIWGGDDEVGNAVGSGIYFVRIEAGDFRATGKMLITR